MTRSALQHILLAVICALSVTSAVLGQAPDSVSFQGYLTNPGGDPITQAGVNMTFKLYKNSVAVWTEAQSVDIVGGVFSVLLGKVSALDTMAFNVPIDLGITVGGDPEIIPRTPLAAAPYAKALPGLYTVYREDSPFRGFNVIGGGPFNELGSNVVGATISGGGGYGEGGVFDPNKVLNDFATVGGGYSNTASGLLSTVGGGRSNQATDLESVVSGGRQNTATAEHATVSGGLGSDATGVGSSIGGGSFNVASGETSTVAGGEINHATDNDATVGGGSYNNATGGGSTIVGGRNNVADGTNSAVLGGQLNRAAGTHSVAAGFNAKSLHDGTFIWNDNSSNNTNDSLKSTGENQFIIRASGGVGIGTNAPRAMLTLQGPEDRIMGPSIFFRGDAADQFESGRIRFVEGTSVTNHRGAYIHYDGSGQNALHIGTHNTSDSLTANDVNVITVKRAGGVAIGTDDPGNHQLRIYSSGTGSGGSTIEAENLSTGAGVAARLESNGTDAILVMTHSGTGDIMKGFSTAGSNLVFRIDNAGGVTADGAFTGGGADLAEAFDVIGDNAWYSPGDVMVISTTTDRTVEKSSSAHSTLIAGVYATKPGVLLSDMGMDADLSKKIPMAIVGVVPTKVTAENGPIRRGDMLVTSSTSGHAMAADQSDVRIGTVIGKALQNFDGPGEGLIEVLVNVK